jgi:hypothetical protein
VAYRARGFENLDWRMVSSRALCCVARSCLEDLLQTRISSTRTMKPTTPPPVPYCEALELMVLTGAAEQRAARQRWRRMLRLNMVVTVR